MHEFGHGLYEHQIARELDRTPLCRGTSLGLHESQSRMWENLVGRSLPFWQPLLPAPARDVPGRARRLRRSTRFYRVDQPRAALADPRRGRRGDLQPAHHPALRAGAGDPRRRGRRSSDLPEVWNARDRRLPRHRRARRPPRHPPGHALGRRPHRLLPDLRARQRDLRADLGAGPRRPARPRRRSSSRASSARCASGCATTCTSTAASSRRPRRSSASSAARSTPSRTCATCARSSAASTGSRPATA